MPRQVKRIKPSICADISTDRHAGKGDNTFY